MIARPRPLIEVLGSNRSGSAQSAVPPVLGNRETAVYGGSWTEWGGRDDTPVEAS
jgi:thiosulfate/3-mercaptopyruvate sulfurtransferase